MMPILLYQILLRVLLSSVAVSALQVALHENFEFVEDNSDHTGSAVDTANGSILEVSQLIHRFNAIIRRKLVDTKYAIKGRDVYGDFASSLRHCVCSLTPLDPIASYAGQYRITVDSSGVPLSPDAVGCMVRSESLKGLQEGLSTFLGILSMYESRRQLIITEGTYTPGNAVVAKREREVMNLAAGDRGKSVPIKCYDGWVQMHSPLTGASEVKVLQSAAFSSFTSESVNEPTLVPLPQQSFSFSFLGSSAERSGHSSALTGSVFNSHSSVSASLFFNSETSGFGILTNEPTMLPTITGSEPTLEPTVQPSTQAATTLHPTFIETFEPMIPTIYPTFEFTSPSTTLVPTLQISTPTTQPTFDAPTTAAPRTGHPSTQPTATTATPTILFPTNEPTVQIVTTMPTLLESTTESPTEEPSTEPTAEPSATLTAMPTEQPSDPQPTVQATLQLFDVVSFDTSVRMEGATSEELDVASEKAMIRTFAEVLGADESNFEITETIATPNDGGRRLMESNVKLQSEKTFDMPSNKMTMTKGISWEMRDVFRRILQDRTFTLEVIIRATLNMVDFQEEFDGGEDLFEAFKEILTVAVTSGTFGEVLDEIAEELGATVVQSASVSQTITFSELVQIAPPTFTPTNAPNEDDEDGDGGGNNSNEEGLAEWELSVIIVGGVLFISIIIAGAYCYKMKGRKGLAKLHDAFSISHDVSNSIIVPPSTADSAKVNPEGGRVVPMPAPSPWIGEDCSVHNLMELGDAATVPAESRPNQDAEADHIAPSLSYPTPPPPSLPDVLQLPLRMTSGSKSDRHERIVSPSMVKGKFVNEEQVVRLNSMSNDATDLNVGAAHNIPSQEEEADEEGNVYDRSLLPCRPLSSENSRKFSISHGRAGVIPPLPRSKGTAAEERGQNVCDDEEEEERPSPWALPSEVKKVSIIREGTETRKEQFPTIPSSEM